MRTHDMEKVTRNLSILVAASNQPNFGIMRKVWIQSGKCRPKYARQFLFGSWLSTLQKVALMKPRT